ncbi:MAG: hypothetical protein KBA60_05930 [Flavobacteriales bacterium]|nr:hypothetical protein [Flavobacteriales bacterium]MBP6641893.1 hypothetical protein [Flavobacteriales bacterium]MBP7155526.1 hypothetical protein [Flavobacteriales bacterium]HQV74413.1 hypothetical protein [Flavobacteriales bacterium]HQW40238.1 hypothetical protein [Flavobacteriales bacterium]
MTTGKTYGKRVKDQSVPRVLDARTQSVLEMICTERKGKALDAYLRTGLNKRV